MVIKKNIMKTIEGYTPENNLNPIKILKGWQFIYRINMLELLRQNEKLNDNILIGLKTRNAHLKDNI